MAKDGPCPECGGTSLFQTAGDFEVSNLLPGLGTLWTGPKATFVLCADCGHLRAFASEDVRARVRRDESPHWDPVGGGSDGA